jgi:hypothetical protein
MIFRMVRRAPWIAIGAAGAYFLDAASGASRRRDVTDRAREAVDRLKAQWLGSSGAETVRSDGAFDDVPDQTPSGPEASPPSVGADRVRARAKGLLAEEEAAGVGGPERGAMAERILEESDARVSRRTSSERRRSEDTVDPVVPAEAAGTS